VEIIYQLTAEDYRHGMVVWRTRNALRRWSYRLNFFLVPALFAAGVILLVWGPHLEPWYLPSILIFIGVLWALSVVVAPRLQARLQFRRMPTAQVPITIDASDSGLHIKSAHATSEVAWSAYMAWGEGKSVFIVMPQPRIYVPIPKRAFNEEQLAEFREILRRNIGRR